MRHMWGGYKWKGMTQKLRRGYFLDRISSHYFEYFYHIVCLAVNSKGVNLMQPESLKRIKFDDSYKS